MIWDARVKACQRGVANGLLDPHGDGVVTARLSSDEIEKGETIGFHVQSALQAPKRDGRVPLRIIASLRNSGYRSNDDRRDVQQLENWVESGECAWVATSFANRLARGRLQIEEIYDLLRSADIELYIGAVNRQIDWYHDDALLAAWAMNDSLSGRSIKEQTHGAIIRRYLLMGRGWPGYIRYGTKRGEDLYLYEDPEQTKVIRWLHKRYQQLCAKGKGGLRDLKKEAKKLWAVDLSHERIRTILMDPLYVTGEWHVTYLGYAVACRPVKFANPVSKDTFQRTQELLALRQRSNTSTPLGECLLNYVPFFWRPLMDVKLAKGQERSRFRGSLDKRRKEDQEMFYTLRHVSPQDPRITIPKSIEKVVIREIKKVLRSQFARHAAAAMLDGVQQQPPDNGSSAEAEEVERQRLQERLALVKRREAEAKRQWMDGFLEGDSGPEEWKELVGEVKAERKRLERQLALQERPKPKRRRRRPRIQDQDRDGYLRSVDAILTEETPDDHDHRVARAALVQSLLSMVIVDRVDGSGFSSFVVGSFPTAKAVLILTTSTVSGRCPGRRCDGPRDSALNGRGAKRPGRGPISQRADHCRGRRSASAHQRPPRPLRPRRDERHRANGHQPERRSTAPQQLCQASLGLRPRLEAQELVRYLNHNERPPEEFRRAYIGRRRNTTIPKVRRLAKGRLSFRVCRILDRTGAKPTAISEGVDLELAPIKLFGNPHTLGHAAAAGRLRAERVGHLWFTKQEWVDEWAARRRIRPVDLRAINAQAVPAIEVIGSDWTLARCEKALAKAARQFPVNQSLSLENYDRFTAGRRAEFPSGATIREVGRGQGLSFSQIRARALKGASAGRKTNIRPLKGKKQKPG